MDCIIETNLQIIRRGMTISHRVYIQVLNSICAKNSHLETCTTFFIISACRLDSTIVTPYEKWIPFKNASLYYSRPPERNYALNKTKKVAWFVSHCKTPNRRENYTEELAKYIEVDIFGKCGNKTCKRRDAAHCFNMLNTDYKFYLAFENSNCKDYITEKLYWNGLP